MPALHKEFEPDAEELEKIRRIEIEFVILACRVDYSDGRPSIINDNTGSYSVEEWEVRNPQKRPFSHMTGEQSQRVAEIIEGSNRVAAIIEGGNGRRVSPPKE